MFDSLKRLLVSADSKNGSGADPDDSRSKAREAAMAVIQGYTEKLSGISAYTPVESQKELDALLTMVSIDHLRNEREKIEKILGTLTAYDTDPELMEAHNDMGEVRKMVAEVVERLKASFIAERDAAEEKRWRGIIDNLEQMNITDFGKLEYELSRYAEFRSAPFYREFYSEFKKREEQILRERLGEKSKYDVYHPLRPDSNPLNIECRNSSFKLPNLRPFRAIAMKFVFNSGKTIEVDPLDEYSVKKAAFYGIFACANADGEGEISCNQAFDYVRSFSFKYKNLSNEEIEAREKKYQAMEDKQVRLLAI